MQKNLKKKSAVESSVLSNAEPIGLRDIEKRAMSALKKLETIDKNLQERRQFLMEKVEKIDKDFEKNNAEKRKIRLQTRKEIVNFAKNNF